MAVRIRGMRELIADLEALPERAEKAFPKVVSKGALNIKTEWRAAWDGLKHPPTHIPHLVSGIGYDTAGKTPVWGADVGVHPDNSQAALAHLIEYGSINNAPHPAGLHALDAEAPRFVEAVGDVAQRLLDES
ncbi:MAG: hypothetical protein V4515_12790 [Chloroflexota bacterium]